jgi:hypothetical protein
VRVRILLLALLVGSLAACGGAPAKGPAGRCADVVRIDRGLQGGVAVVGQPVETSEGSVEIEYEGTDAMNLPVKGSAACTFAVGEGGALTLVEAVVDGSPLDEEAIDSIRSELGDGG